MAKILENSNDTVYCYKCKGHTARYIGETLIFDLELAKAINGKVGGTAKIYSCVGCNKVFYRKAQ